MNALDEDLNESGLFCKSLIQKRKIVKNNNLKKPRQLKLTLSHLSRKTNQPKEGEKTQAKENNSLTEQTGVKSEDLNSKISDSKSIYFNIKRSINTCPLCLKLFKTDSAYSAHMKQCAKTHKMTTQQLLEVLEMQKKQMRESANLEKCVENITELEKNTSKNLVERNVESCDLGLGLALSKSLISEELQPITSLQTQKATLEEFGFTSSNTALLGPPSRKKNESDKKTLLRARTMEERQRIIIEKVAVVLLDEGDEMDIENKKLNVNLSIKNIEVPHLWSLSENDEKYDWYVERIKTLIGSKENNVKEDTKATYSDNIRDEVSRLGLPEKEIYRDWKKMINNSFKSDFTGKTKDCQNVYLHSLVLFARCPEISEENFKTIFNNFNLATVLILLEFLYCGTLNGLLRSEINDLYNLTVALNFEELIKVLNRLQSNLLERDCTEESVLSPDSKATGKKATMLVENKEAALFENKDLFIEEDATNLTQKSHEPVGKRYNESSSENECIIEESYNSFIRRENERETFEKIDSCLDKEVEEGSMPTRRDSETMEILREYNEEDIDVKNSISGKISQLERRLTNDSDNRDLDDELKNRDVSTSSDCIILSSGSDSNTEENCINLQQERSKTSPQDQVDYEIPHYDPYDNFHCFSEKQLSPVSLHSQSLLMGDVSAESLKLSNATQEDMMRSNDAMQEESRTTVGYCSTPVTFRHKSKIKSSTKNSLEINSKSANNKKRDLSANRILRKSLNLELKARNLKKRNFKKKQTGKEKELAEAMTHSVLHELSKSVFKISPLRKKKLLETTPIQNPVEFGESVTPSPNFSNMGESMLKEQLKKYGLKKSLAKSKAKKILRLIYEELHPFYNQETGKIVKMRPKNSPKAGDTSKLKRGFGKILKKSKNNTSKNTKKHNLNSSKESEEMTDESTLSLDGPTKDDSNGSEFEDLSETLTQSVHSNPFDLSSAFCEFLEKNPKFHEKILLYEPIWLEELQIELKKAFNKHFKLSDLMDYLDRKCITFRTAAQRKTSVKKSKKKKSDLI